MSKLFMIASGRHSRVSSFDADDSSVVDGWAPEILSRQGSRSVGFSRQSSASISEREAIAAGLGEIVDFRRPRVRPGDAPHLVPDVEQALGRKEWDPHSGPPNVPRGNDKVYDLSVVNLTYKVMETKGKEVLEKVLLNEVTARARHGEILAVVGPSGSSKTTFLDALAGRIRRQSLEGSVLVNGKPWDASFMKVSQYVMQDDALFPLLTTTETLMFSARFRLPSSMSYADKLKRVELVIQQLGLSNCAHTYVGDELVKGVSGGERRRISMGVELIHDPAVLFLDEPTSGLDSTSALHVVEILSMLAVERNRTVIVTLHQPSHRILQLTHKMLVMARGNVVYHGRLEEMTRFFSDLGRNVPGNVNIVEYALDAIEEYQEDTEGFHRIVAFQKEKQSIHDLERLASLRDKTEPPQQPGYANSVIVETLALADRTFRNIFRTPELFASRLGLAMGTGLLMGTIFFRAGYNEKGARQREAFLAFTLALFIFTAADALPVFLCQRQVYIREASRGAYRASSYTLAQALVFTPFQFIAALLFTTISYFLVDLVHVANAFFIVVLALFLAIAVSNALVVFVGSLAPNAFVGNSLAVAIFAFMFMLSGFFIPRTSIPDYWLWLHYLSVFKYPFEILVHNEMSRVPLTVWYGNTTSNDILRSLGASKVNIKHNVGILLGMYVGHQFFFYLALRFKTNNMKN